MFARFGSDRAALNSHLPSLAYSQPSTESTSGQLRRNSRSAGVSVSSRATFLIFSPTGVTNGVLIESKFLSLRLADGNTLFEAAEIHTGINDGMLASFLAFHDVECRGVLDVVHWFH